MPPPLGELSPTTAACPAFGYLPECSSPVVERLLQAGALCIGKTNLDQFGSGLAGDRSPYGACRNVFDPAYTMVAKIAKELLP